MIIASDFTKMLGLAAADAAGTLFESKERADPETVGGSAIPKYLVHNLPEEETWGNHIIVEQANALGGFGSIHKGYYSSPVHLKKVLEELGVMS